VVLLIHFSTLTFLLQSCIISKFTMLGTFLDYLWPHIRKSCKTFYRVVWGWLCCNCRLRDISNCWSDCMFSNIILFVHFHFGGFFLLLFVCRVLWLKLTMPLEQKDMSVLSVKAFSITMGIQYGIPWLLGFVPSVILHLTRWLSTDYSYLNFNLILPTFSCLISAVKSWPYM